MHIDKHSVNDETKRETFLTAFTPKPQQGLCHISQAQSNSSKLLQSHLK